MENIKASVIAENIVVAAGIIEEYKRRNSLYRFRVETCVNKDSVKLYVINREYINEIVTIDGGRIVKLEKKVKITKEEK